MRPGVENIRSLPDPQRTYLWEVKFLTLPTIITGISSDDLNFRCTSTTLPKTSNSVIRLDIRGVEARFPGPNKFSDSIQMSFVETTDAKIREVIRYWRVGSFDPVTGIQLPKSLIEGQIQICQLDGLSTTTMAYNLYGCWLSDYDPGQANSESSYLGMTGTFTYDYAVEVR